MAEETKTEQALAGGADGLRDVPTSIDEYTKFVKDGGLDHNAKVLGREAAEKAAKEAGVIPADGEKPAGDGEDETIAITRRVSRLQRKIGERDQRIKDLEKQLGTRSAPANGATTTTAPAKPADKPAAHVNGKAPEADQTPPKPKEADFKTYGEFIEALTDWKTDRKLEARDAKRAQEQQQQTEAQQGAEITRAHNERVAEAKKRYPDWEQAFKGLNDQSFSDPMTVFIFESDVGSDVTYYLVTHRDEMARIAKLSPIRQAGELGKIEDKILAARTDKEGDKEADKEDDKGGAKEPEEEEPPKKAAAKAATSKAPPPEKPIAGRGTAADEMPDPSDFVAYEAWSKRQAAKKKAAK